MQPVVRGVGLSPLPRPERLYFWFGEPVDTSRYAGRDGDDEAARAVRDEVKAAVEDGIAFLRAERERDPNRGLLQRLRRRVDERRPRSPPEPIGGEPRCRPAPPAGLAWWIASSVAGHELPVSAPVVAVIAIGAATGGRWRRTLGVMIGLTIGVGLATLLVSTFGHGPLSSPSS